MSISERQQLEVFAYWRKRMTATESGKRLWGLEPAAETRLMNQAPIYVLPQKRVDLYAEVPLKGNVQIDLSAQYLAKDFVEANLLAGRSVAKEGEFFHYYAQELARCKPSLPAVCSLYLEADIDEKYAGQVASFINLSGDFVRTLLGPVLQYWGRQPQIVPVQHLLQTMQSECMPWHIGFMESRQEKPLRLVLILKQGLTGLQPMLKRIGMPPLPGEGWQLLQRIDALNLFHYMLDIDVLPDGSIGDIVGIELLPKKEAVLPAQQEQLVTTAEYTFFCKILQDAALADRRIEGLAEAIFATCVHETIYIYSRISHVKLRWQAGKAMPAKVYVQLRGVPKQGCLNEALGYIRVAEDAEGE